MPNQLINETSPYLLQHAHNPVDWYPWSPEALERSKAEDKPILLSIGYSACHWCHVMERESFEDEETARMMNELFVNIKVDREERPDVDSIYMAAVQAMTGRGGWPMTMFLTPDGIPFYGGTYFPPEDRGSMPSFQRVLRSVAEAYRTRREEIQQSALQLKAVLQRPITGGYDPGLLRQEILDEAFQNLSEVYDDENGGFAGSPKFPQTTVLEFLLRYYNRTRNGQVLTMVEQSLTHMAQGGIYDQLGGGFHRYSVDGFWLVPHFEKMLYDNALLSRLYLHTYLATGNPMYKRVCEEVLDYVLREMTDPQGGFYSTQDADSEGEEGKFYLWTQAELEEVLGEEEARLVGGFFGVRAEGNFDFGGHNILNRFLTPLSVAQELGVSVTQLLDAVERCRSKLLSARAQREWPNRDDKVLTAWNGLMLRSFAEAAAALGREDYLEAAKNNAHFISRTLLQGKQVLRTYRAGQAKLNGYLEDYAALADGLLALYEATLDLQWFQQAQELLNELYTRFWDETNGGFFDTAHDHEELISRPKDYTDGATPSGNSIAVELLIRFARLTGRSDYEQKAATTLRILANLMGSHPSAFGHLLCVLDLYLAPSQEIAVVGPREHPETQALLKVVWQHYLPNHVLAFGEPEDFGAVEAIALLEERDTIGGQPTAYVCQNFACQLPVTDPDQFAQQLGIAV